MGAEPELQISCVLCDRLTAPDALVDNPLCGDCAIDLRAVPRLGISTPLAGTEAPQGTYRKLR